MNTTMQTIEAATVPAAPVMQGARHLTQKERTSLIRQALRTAGIKGASVKAATGSMCYWTKVRFEGLAHAEVNWSQHVPYLCTTCAANSAAVKKIEAIILAAFPDLGDRSDRMTDYHDFMFMVNVDSPRVATVSEAA